MTADELAVAPHYVYRLFDPADVLLYVGCSVNPEARLRTHRSDQPWSDIIDRQTVEGPFSRIEALAREAAAIADERPRFNVRHNEDPERWEGPSEGAFLYVKNRVNLAGRCVARAFWNGELPLRPTFSDVRAWVQTLDSRYHAYPCPFAPDCHCAADVEAEYEAWAAAQESA